MTQKNDSGHSKHEQATGAAGKPDGLGKDIVSRASNAFNFNFKVFVTGRGTERIQSRLWQWSNSTSLDRCKDAKKEQ